MSDSEATRNIPEDVRRRVRQECFFGCVLCGMPVFHYDHIQEFSQVRCHEAHNIALLCPNHHQDKTSKRLSQEMVQRARDAPCNGREGATGAYPIHPGEALTILVGSLTASTDMAGLDYPVIIINRETFFAVHSENDALSFSFRLTDLAGNLLLNVSRGEMTVATDVWDYRYEGCKLTIRKSQGDILLEMDLSSSLVRIIRGAFIDHHASGLAIRRSGAAHFVFDGYDLGTIDGGSFGFCPGGAIRIARGSVVPADEWPSGVGFYRYWPAEAASLMAAAELRGLVRRFPGLS